MMPTRAVHWDEDLNIGVVTWSDGLAAFLGEELASMDRPSWEARVHDDDRASLFASTHEVRRGLRAQWTGSYRVFAHGSWRSVREQIVLVEQTGMSSRIVGTIRDDVPAVMLPDRERRFATFVDQLPLLAWEADADGWIDFYNHRWFDYTGMTFAQMEGWGWARVQYADDLPRLLRVWRNALTNGLPWEDTFRLRRADGVFRWHLSRAFPLRNSTGEIVRWFGSNTDIHDQRLALEERDRLLRFEQSLRAEAEAASREKDEFIAVVSHELRTPLANVLTRTQLLRPLATDPALASGFEKIERNAQKLARLIEDLLDTSRIISGNLQIERGLVDLMVTTGQVIENVALEATKRGVTIRVQGLEAGHARVVGDSARLEQVAINFLMNALKFSHDGGVIDVRVALDDGDVLLEVRDYGEGYEAAMQSQLFERFNRGDSSARRRHGGLGLGLSIVRQLVAAHGGRVAAESAGPGTGATFRAWFPSAATEPAPLAPAEPSTEKGSTVTLVGIRVLGVDDDADARDVLALALLACGATLTLAGSVAEALERLRIEVPDAILTDLAMPEIDGLGLLDRIRASEDPRIRTLPVVAVTAHATAKDRQVVMHAGFDAYIAKPFDPDALSRLVAGLVRHRLMSS